MSVQPPEAAAPAAQYLRVSREVQRDSLAIQRAQIAAFAAVNGYEVVATYCDTGRSGLRLHGRTALQALLAEVLAGEARFSTILVQDISRWGRFQDPDEAAHYEFICREAGVAVRYCVEPIPHASGPAAGMVKALKRLMAADFSRELSDKTRAAQFSWAAAGYKMGGVAGYGLRRRVVTVDGRVKGVLGPGEQKLLQTDHVRLIAGPPKEVETVGRIYHLYLHEGLTLEGIAAHLNAEQTFGEGGRPWNSWTIGQVLANEKYVGVYRFGRRRRTLAGERLDVPADRQLRVEGACPQIIAREIFEAVAAKRAKTMLFLTEPEMLVRARGLLAAQGSLTCKMIAARPDLPSPRTYNLHFGPLNRLHARLGFYPPAETRRGGRGALVLPGCIDLGDARHQMRRQQFEREHMTLAQAYTAFAGDHLIAMGSLPDVALAVKAATEAGDTKILVFDDATGATVELDLRGSPQDVLLRLPAPIEPEDQDDQSTPRARGRPKLGVTPREITLLPRHWDWLATQPGGASATLRKLVEQAARDSVEVDAARAAQTTAYRVMYALAGHLAHFEEALRALYAPDPKKLAEILDQWPQDVASYIRGRTNAIGSIWTASTKI
ncbi:MAG: DUF2239 family protein [Phenylobacterium sp.]|uniref:DUF2239 family protein n=1 Tax=Phenylobacterium sp. TaxID=1871053 RepID=UPI001B6AEB7B|nr:DUF2239 family protein [Phenylobacterium sp.]MBP7648465.1 DUF2239 family protein [Phenylobacterium sp.]MBP7818043.1 DUF2239 family protein [Phenylobacterium sp.]MBP9753805.1 DUF2239 family protein [Phenylobacterium sp.]